MFYHTGWRRLFGAEDFTEDMTLALLAALGIRIYPLVLIAGSGCAMLKIKA